MSDNPVSGVTCPVCTAFGEGDNRTFTSKWRLAWHIAVEAKMCRKGDQSHRKWFIKNAGKFEFKDYSMTQIAKIAQFVYPVVKELSVNTSQDPRALLLNKATRLEGELRSFVEKVLRKELGGSGDTWWYEGVHKDIRIKCAIESEKDKGRKLPFAYTNIIDLLNIIDDNWRAFIPFIRQYYRDNEKSKLKGKIDRLKNIRNDSVHGEDETKQQGKDLEFVTDFEKEITMMCREL
jgi:hypothetical protein